MSFALRQSTPPLIEPVSLADMKLHLRVDIDDDDSLIQALISAARERAEDFTGRCFIPRGLTFGLDRFPALRYLTAAPSRSDYDSLGNPTWDGTTHWNRSQTITIPRSPLIAVTGITYCDQTTQTWMTLDPSLYVIDNLSEPARLKPVYGVNWPIALNDLNTVLIQLSCGYQIGVVEEQTVSATANTNGFFTAPLNQGAVALSLGTVVDVLTGQPVTGCSISNGVLIAPSSEANKQVTISYYVPNVPFTAIAAIKLICGALYNNRESFVVGQGNAVELPLAAEALLTPMRVLPFGYFGGG